MVSGKYWRRRGGCGALAPAAFGFSLLHRGRRLGGGGRHQAAAGSFHHHSLLYKAQLISVHHHSLAGRQCAAQRAHCQPGHSSHQQAQRQHQGGNGRQEAPADSFIREAQQEGQRHQGKSSQPPQHQRFFGVDLPVPHGVAQKAQRIAPRKASARSSDQPSEASLRAMAYTNRLR